MFADDGILFNQWSKNVTTSPNTKDESRPTSVKQEEQPLSEEKNRDQILHLKRLLVTLKQHYEKSLHTLRAEWQTEKTKRIGLQSELLQTQDRISEIREHQESEVQALVNQITTLKELLKKTQAESESNRALFTEQIPSSNASENTDELEIIVAALRAEAEKRETENELLRENLNRAQAKIATLDQERNDRHNRSVEDNKQTPEIRGLEERYIEILNEKIESEHLAKHLTRELEERSAQIESMQHRLSDLIEEKSRFKAELDAKENDLVSGLKKIEDLQEKIERQTTDFLALQAELEEIREKKTHAEQLLSLKDAEIEENTLSNRRLLERVADLDKSVEEKEEISGKYEAVRHERNELEERYKEATELKLQAEYRCSGLDLLVNDQDLRLQECTRQLETLEDHCKTLSDEYDRMKSLFEETEERLKASQQHLAKKVKEVALLEEKLEEQEINLHDLMELIHGQKTRLSELDLEIERRETEENHLKDELHRTLKEAEIQTAKWEEKYFYVYDQCQKNEQELKELNKLKEKHFRMQDMLSKLETVMSSPYPSESNEGFLRNDIDERLVFPRPVQEKMPFRSNEIEETNEIFDVFGMRQTFDKAKPYHTPGNK